MAAARGCGGAALALGQCSRLSRRLERRGRLGWRRDVAQQAHACAHQEALRYVGAAAASGYSSGQAMAC